MTLRQKEPRVRNEAHLRFIRSLPCCICGGIDTEAAHIRTASLEHGKRETGGSERPSDIWCLPLCNNHHREQHSMNEISFWSSHGIDPFILAMTLRAPK
jgi:hypothetical protein